MKKVLITFLLIMFWFATIWFTFAHPGRTDKRWWHTCKTNCKKWGLKYGQYHYHYKRK